MRALLLLVAGACVTAVAQAGETFDRKVAADAHGTVEISNVAGRVEVTGWDRPEVEVHGELGPGAERIDVVSDKGRTTIRVVVPNHSFRSIATTLEVHVPKDSELDVSGVSADVTSIDVQGPLQLKSVSGDVRADAYQGNVEIKSVSGDVAVRGRGQNASLHLSTISGNIKADHVGGDLEATTISGELNFRLDTTHNVRIRSTSGDVGLENTVAKGGAVDVESVSGDFIVRAKPEAGLDYEVSTFSGDIKDCMDGEVRMSHHGPGKRLTGSVGQNADGARIRLKTMSGDVELCSRS